MRDPRVAVGIIAVERTSFVQPDYPAAAMGAHLNGTVILHAIITKDGSIQKLGVVASTSDIFDVSAIDAVRQWRYRPYVLNGMPADVDTYITLNFAMEPSRLQDGSGRPSPYSAAGQPDEHIPSLPH